MLSISARSKMTPDGDTSHMTKKFYVVCRLFATGDIICYAGVCVVFGHEALKCLNSQKRLNARHSKWVKFLQDCTFLLNYKARVENKVADVLCRRVMILITMSAEVTVFERLREKCESCPDFGEIYVKLQDGSV